MNTNPLIDDNPSDTITNVIAALDFIRFNEAHAVGAMPDDSARTGKLLLLRAVAGAVGSLEPHLGGAHG